MSSKLAYLSSKYTSNSKSKKKKKKHKRDQDDIDILPVPPVLDEDEDQDGEDGDGPTVVGSVPSTEGPWATKSRDDSSSEEEKRPRRRRHDSSDDEPEDSIATKRRQRHDSSSSEEDSDHNQRRRHDSSDNESTQKPKRQRHDSSSSCEDEDDDPRRHKMSSGHAAGLQTGQDFAKKESKIQSKRQDEAKETVEKYGIGETVYRENVSTNKNSKKPKLTEAERIQLQTGRAQIEAAEKAKQEFDKIKESSFARRSDDAELEDLRKQEIRPDDPMAHYAVRQTSTTNQPSRPVYKGPPAKPNRFHIRPGHRWDAVDRGNGFEDRLLAKQASLHHKRQREYQNSALDM